MSEIEFLILCAAREPLTLDGRVVYVNSFAKIADGHYRLYIGDNINDASFISNCWIVEVYFRCGKMTIA